MELFLVTIRANIEVAGAYKSDNVLILCAESAEEAEERATNFFNANGLYVKTAVAGTTPRVIDVKSALLSAMVYNGHFVEHPETYLKRMPADPTGFQKLVRSLSASEYEQRCKADLEFKKRADDLKTF